MIALSQLGLTPGIWSQVKQDYLGQKADKLHFQRNAVLMVVQ